MVDATRFHSLALELYVGFPDGSCKLSAQMIGFSDEQN
jgi:hypothetical protein